MVLVFSCEFVSRVPSGELDSDLITITSGDVLGSQETLDLRREPTEVKDSNVLGLKINERSEELLGQPDGLFIKDHPNTKTKTDSMDVGLLALGLGSLISVKDEGIDGETHSLAVD